MKPTKPVTALTGQNEVGKRDFLAGILKHYPRDVISIYYADEAEASVIIAQCEQNSLFSTDNVVVVKNADEKDFVAALREYLQHPNPDCCLILLAEEFPAKLTDLLAEKGDIQDFRKPYKNEILRYINDRLRSAGIKYDEDVPDFLIELDNDDMEQVEMHVNVLLEYSQEKKSVTLEDLKGLLSSSNNLSIFDLIDGIFLRDPRKALHALNDLRINGKSVIEVNRMILRSAKNLWGYLAIPDKNGIDRKLGVKAYEVKKMGEFARSVNLKFVSAVLDLTKNVEIKSKSMAEEFAFLEIECFIAAQKWY